MSQSTDDNCFTIGGNKEELPEVYVNRSVSLAIVKKEFLETIEDNTSIFISHCETLPDYQQILTNFNIIDLHNKNKEMDHSKLDIYVTQNACSSEDISTVLKRKDTSRKYHLFQLINDGNLKWIKSEENIEVLEEFRCDDFLIEESKYCSRDFNQEISVICADPGMGKSTFTKNLKNSLNVKYWTIIVNATTLSELLKQEVSNIHSYLTEKYDIFEKNVFDKMYYEKKRVLYIWDGIDELIDENIEKIIKLIKKMSQQSFPQLVTSRNHLRKLLEQSFNVCSNTIKVFDDEQQKEYIKKRIMKKCQDEEVSTVVEKIKANVDKFRYNEILAIPLQIYMLTELICQDTNKYLELISDTFSMVDLYGHFVDAKFSIAFHEKGQLRQCNDVIKTIISSYKDEILKMYKAVSTKILFDNNDTAEMLKNINLDTFLEKIKKEGDYFGFITKVTNDNKVTFAHISYAEYFAAVFCHEEWQNISTLKYIIFKPRYNNVRFMFDLLMAGKEPLHLSVLYKNFAVFETDVKFYAKDKGGRNFLHLACSWGQRYPSLRDSSIDSEVVIDESLASDVKEEKVEYQTMFTSLEDMSKITDNKDDLFNMAPLEYADATSNLFPLFFICKTQVSKKLDGSQRNFETVVNILFYSIKFDYEYMLNLLPYIPDIKSKNEGNNLVHLSIKYSAAKCLLWFLSETNTRKLINKPNHKRILPIEMACEIGNLKIFNLLAKSGACISDKLLLIASKHGHAEILLCLLERKGLDIDTKDEFGNTPFLLACQEGHEKIYHILKNSEADVTKTCKSGYTALRKATDRGHRKIINLLQTQKIASVNMADKHGVTPLHSACSKGSEKEVQMLLDSGADINAETEEGYTPVYLSCRGGFQNVSKMLVEHGANLSLKYDNGSTLLHKACQNGLDVFVEFLINVGMNLNEENDNGVTPLHLARECGHAKFVQLLCDNGFVDDLEPPPPNIHKDIDLLLIQENLSEQRDLIYSRRPGTVDKGRMYELYILVFFILRFLENEDYLDWTVWNNDSNFGCFDDLILTTISNYYFQQNYAIQLKYTANRHKLIPIAALTALKGNFSLNKYFRSYQELDIRIRDSFVFVVWTNNHFTLQNHIMEIADAAFEQLDKECRVQLQMIRCEAPPVLFNNPGSTAYKFKLLNEGDHQLEHFFQNFFFITNQIQFDTVEEENLTMTQKLFSYNKFILNNLIHFITKWTLLERKTWKLSKEIMVNVLALQLLDGYIYPLSFEPIDPSTGNHFLKKAVNNFDVTVFDEKSLETVNKIWNNYIETLENRYETMRFLQVYQFPHHWQSDHIFCSILLWLMCERPLIVKGSPSTYEAIRLCKRKKFILIDKNVDDALLQNLKVFQKLSDLEQFDEIFSELTLKIRSLDINLSAFIEKHPEVADNLTTDQLLEIITNPDYAIKQKSEHIPDFCVTRSFYKNFIKFTYLQERSREVTIMISNIAKEDERIDFLQNFDLIFLDDYLNGQDMQSKEEQRIYISRKNISHEDLHKLHQKVNRKCHYFKFEDNKLEWISSIGSVSDLEPYRIEDDSVDEDQFYIQNLHNVNIVIGDVGTGKTVLMKKIKNKFISKYLTVLLTPKDISRLYDTLKDNFDECIAEMMFPDYTKFDKDFLKYLIREGQVIYLWDAIDEVSVKKRESVLNIISHLSKKSMMQIITSRRYLMKGLEEKFCVLSRKIRPFENFQQIYYIENRLQNDLTIKFKTDVASFLPMNIQGNPLHLYKATEFDRYTNMYHHFIEELFSHYFDEKYGIDRTNDHQLSLTDSLKTQRIENYKLAAMKILFGKDNNECDKFLNEVAMSGDYIGLIVEVTADMIPKFIYKTYAEYFAALYLIDHHKEISLEKLFDRRYTQVRYFFDVLLANESPPHLAVLRRNLNELEKYEHMLNNKDLQGRNVLHLACSWSECCPVVNVDRKDSNMFLINSSRNITKPFDPEYQELLEYLLERCSVDEKDALFGYTAVTYAEKTHCLFALASIEKRKYNKYFRAENEQFNCNLLYYSALYGFDNVFNETEDIKYIYDEDNNSLLHIAVQNNNINIVHKLLSQEMYKKNVDARNNEYKTSLFIACEKGHQDIVEKLINNEADVKVVKNDGTTPLFVTCQKGHLKILEMLVGKGADINARTNDGVTPIQVAFDYGFDEIVQFLVRNGADTKVRNDL